MCKIHVFAGTTEGYEICRFLSANGICSKAYVATEYGERSFPSDQYTTVHSGRLDEQEMEQIFAQEKPELVLDATHPYAAEVTANIRQACEKTGIPYERVLREQGEHESSAVYVEDVPGAVRFLEGTKGNILLTTGSKELKGFTELSDYQERLYARVLSLPSVIESCSGLGVEGKHLIGMQGPFSRELNEAMLKQYDCRYLVTKDTGKAGGFQDKIDAALDCGAVPVIIGRPVQEQGISVSDCKKMLAERYGIIHKPHVTLLGIGMGNPDTLTVEGEKALEKADLLIGARRMTDAVRKPGQHVFHEYRSENIKKYIEEHQEYDNIVIVLSGDVGFYSGARKLLDALGPDVKVLCGISSVVYFMSRIGFSWDDAKIVSAHGRECNLVSHIRYNRKVFSILGTSDGAAVLAKKLVFYGMGDVILYVGENLSYENENIFAKPARELTEYNGDPLCVICAVNSKALSRPSTHGMRDEEFIRGKAPMTKEEVRTVSLSKLNLKKDSLCYDVGAGTGSLSIEMALRAYEGKVWAIEKKEEAVHLIGQNKMKFAADNLEIIEGLAPESLKDLPAPTHAFIGGSSGNLAQIIEILLKKNRHVRIVINCITLETVSEALKAVQDYDFKEHEIVQLTAARSREIGPYHMMMGENPIYIITLQNPEK